MAIGYFENPTAEQLFNELVARLVFLLLKWVKKNQGWHFGFLNVST